MQGLSPAEHGRHRLNRRAHDVVLWLLCGQCRTAGLSVETQHPGSRIPRLEVLAHDPRPHSSRSTELRNFFQKVAVSVEEERKPWAELVDIEPSFNGRLHVGHPVAES